MSVNQDIVPIKQDTRQAKIKFSTQILKRLGEELNPSADQSILELVKNAYDADARNCVIEIKGVDEPGGIIIVSDDGEGMLEDDILNGWLVLGESGKSHKQRTKLGRIPAGSKGLGRLAALRMGSFVRLSTIPMHAPQNKFQLEIDWDRFDQAKLVEDVSLPLLEASSKTKEHAGTTIEILNLKTKIGERELKKIARGLILLADPFGDDPNAFHPVLKSEQYKEMEELVSRRYFDDADYHLSASVDERGRAKAVVQDYKGSVLFEAGHTDLTSDDDTYHCPPATFDLWAFILNTSSFSNRTSTLTEVRQWLSELGGVHLYENGLRVNPYGNPGNDWLDINLSRARSPEERPSTNTSIGVVRVQDSNGLLSQKTDRSGFIENDTFHELRRFCRDALDWMAKRRMEIAEQKRQKTRVESSTGASKSKEKVQQSIKKLSPSRRTELEKLFSKYDKAREEEVKSLRSEVQLYRTLSTAGITAATFSHESRGNPIKTITLSINSISRRIKQRYSDDYEASFAKPIDLINRALNSLAVLGSATLRLLAHEKRRYTRVNVHSVINNVLETFEPFFIGRDLTITKQLAKGNPFLRSTEAAIESIVTNLLNNSIAAFENHNVESRQIDITTEVQETILIIDVADNGPGIEGIAVKDIWLPGETTNLNGTGLGLTIVRDAVLDLGGTVSAVPHGRLGGAELIIELPILGI
jgi:signal transduction histidine kinase